MAPSPDAPLVFVSKATEDHNLAMHMVRLLEAAGLRAWVAPRDIPAGMDHAAAIGAAIPKCTAMIVLLSPDAADSEWVNIEVETALTHKVRRFPLAIGELVNRVDSLPTAMRTRLAVAQIRADGDIAGVVADVAASLAARTSDPHSERRSRRRRSPVGTPAGTSDRRVKVAQDPSEVFVGAGRRQMVDDLLAAWDDVVTSGSARMVVLLGETGSGKTRIVQEFYERLTSSQSHPCFWPLSLKGHQSGGQRGLRQSRKRVAPLTLDPPSGAQADFIWLGHAVDEGHEGRADFGLVALAESLGQVLAVANASAPESAAATMARTALPGTSPDRTAIENLLRTGSAAADRSLATPGSVEAFWGGVQVLWRDGGVPLIVAVEDAHYAGEPTIALLEQLVSASGLRVLALVCAQESQLGGGRAGPRRPLGRLLDADLPHISTVRLTGLDKSEMERIARHALPDIDAATVRAFVKKVDGNPYYAHTLLIEMVRAARQGRLDDAWVSDRPGSFEEELRLQWRDLDDDVRQVLSGLALLGTQVPERMGLNALRAAMPDGTDKPLIASIGSGWLRRLQRENLLRFLERPRWVIANEESYEEWSEDDRRAIIQRALNTLEVMATETGLGDALLQELHVLLALSADEQTVPFDRAAAVRSGLANIERLFLAYDDAAMLTSARRVESLVVGHEAEPGMATVAVQSAVWLRHALHANLSFGSTRAQVRAAADAAVARGSRVVDTRPDLAAWALAMKSRAHRVRFDEDEMALARDYATQAEELLSQAPVADSTVTAAVIESNAMVAFADGDFRGAAELTEERLATLTNSGMAWDRRSHDARRDGGFYWARVDVKRALRSRADVYRQQSQLWGGMRHRQVAIAAKELVASQVRSGGEGDCEAGFRLISEALTWYENLSGPRHQDARRTRGIWCLAACRLSDEWEHAGDHDASEQLRNDAVAAARLNVELATNDDIPERVANYRSRLAQVLVRAGDVSGVALLRETLEVRCGALRYADPQWPHIDDPLSIEVLWDVAELVAALHRFGHVDEAEMVSRRFGLARVDDWPVHLTRGWRSTRPEHAQAGVL